MINTPIIVPLMTSGNSSYTQKCLEKPELSDLYKKALNQEPFTDEETDRLTVCVNESKEQNGRVRAIIITILVVLFILAIAYIIYLMAS